MTETPLAELSATPRRLAALVSQAGEAGLDHASPGEWSLRVIVAHVLDDEIFDFRLRLERMLSEERPSFGGFPWATGQERRRDPIGELLRDFALQRQASLNLLAGLRTADLGRTARMPRGRTLTVSALVEAWVEHDREHIAQGEALIGGAARRL